MRIFQADCKIISADKAVRYLIIYQQKGDAVFPEFGHLISNIHTNACFLVKHMHLI